MRALGEAGRHVLFGTSLFVTFPLIIALCWGGFRGSQQAVVSMNVCANVLLLSPPMHDEGGIALQASDALAQMPATPGVQCDYVVSISNGDEQNSALMLFPIVVNFGNTIYTPKGLRLLLYDIKEGDTQGQADDSDLIFSVTGETPADKLLKFPFTAASATRAGDDDVLYPGEPITTVKDLLRTAYGDNAGYRLLNTNNRVVALHATFGLNIVLTLVLALCWRWPRANAVLVALVLAAIVGTFTGVVQANAYGSPAGNSQAYTVNNGNNFTGGTYLTTYLVALYSMMLGLHIITVAPAIGLCSG